jgi:zinc protease
MKELTAISQISDEELERARNYVALRFPRAFQTASGIADQLTELVLHDLPDDYFNRYVERILAVTREDAQRVARRYVDPRRVALVVVGDRQTIAEGIEAMELGPVRHLSVEDVLGKAPELGN